MKFRGREHGHVLACSAINVDSMSIPTIRHIFSSGTRTLSYDTCLRDSVNYSFVTVGYAAVSQSRHKVFPITPLKKFITKITIITRITGIATPMKKILKHYDAKYKSFF